MKNLCFASSIALSLIATACQGTDTSPAPIPETPASATADVKNGPPASPLSPAPAKNPDFISQFVNANDTLLARKEFDLLGDQSPQTVLIVRHAGPAANKTYPCELLVLKQTAGNYAVAARSEKVVDCFFNDLAKNATDLNDNLVLSPGRITYVNQGAKSNTSYTFLLSKESPEWYLSNAESNYSIPSETSDNLDSYRELVAYPKDLPKISLSQFDPENIKSAMRKSRQLQK